MKNKTYDRLKWVSLVLLPALSVLYVGLGQLWGVPAVEQVVGSIALLDTVLGLLLGTSSKKYQALTDSPTVMGELVVQQDVDGTPTGVLIDPYDKVPVFREGSLAAFKVTRKPLA